MRRLAPLLALPLAGCFDLLEELKLAADGSGSASVTCWLPLASLRAFAPAGRRWTDDELVAEVERRIADEGRRSAVVRVEKAVATRVGSAVRVEFAGRFDRLEALRGGASRPACDAAHPPPLSIDTFLLPRPASLVREGSGWRFEQTLGRDLPVEVGPHAWAVVVAGLRGRRWRFIVEMPAPVSESNGVDSGTSALWEEDAGALFSGGVDMRAEARPRPLWGAALWGAALLAAMAIAIGGLRRKRPSRSASG